MTPERRAELRAIYDSDTAGIGRSVRDLLDALDAAEKEVDRLRAMAEQMASAIEQWNLETSRLRDENERLQKRVAGLEEALAESEEERVRLAELRQRGCECSDDDACAFARERDGALKRVVELEAALRPFADAWDSRGEDYDTDRGRSKGTWFLSDGDLERASKVRKGDG